ncbi:MAG: nitroreductase family protein [Candidatus Bathyarchaeota archaeon]|nr:nitroreductase family protein [Candidatus Bathyarchaeota archaeon]
MNETIKVIKSRRSIRRFKTEQIGDSELQGILECALLAPNARNQQKWHFTVIQNKDVLNKMVNILKENMLNSGIEFLAERAKDPAFNPFGNAPTLILITADKTARFVEIDCAAAAENILIAAESFGLGSHIMTSTELLFTSEEGKKLKQELGVPEGYEHVCTIALGYKDEVPPAKPRRKDVINYVK